MRSRRCSPATLASRRPRSRRSPTTRPGYWSPTYPRSTPRMPWPWPRTARRCYRPTWSRAGSTGSTGYRSHLRPKWTCPRSARWRSGTSSAADRLRAAGTPLDIVVAAWAAILGRYQGAGDDFFAAGGHSLSAMRLASELRAATGREIWVEQLLKARTVAGIASLIRASPDRASPDRTSPVRARSGRRRTAGAHPGPAAPVVHGPARPRAAAYNVALALRLTGPLDAGRCGRRWPPCRPGTRCCAGGSPAGPAGRGERGPTRPGAAAGRGPDRDRSRGPLRDRLDAIAGAPFTAPMPHCGVRSCCGSAPTPTCWRSRCTTPSSTAGPNPSSSATSGTGTVRPFPAGRPSRHSPPPPSPVTPTARAAGGGVRASRSGLGTGAPGRGPDRAGSAARPAASAGADIPRCGRARDPGAGYHGGGAGARHRCWAPRRPPCSWPRSGCCCAG